MVRKSTARRRHKPRIHRRSAPGAAPGTLSVAPDAMQSKVQVMAYATGRLLEQAVNDLEQLPGLVAEHTVTWINVIGLGHGEVIKRLGELFQLHPLALEDVVNVHQRPKVEPYDQHLYIVSRILRYTDRLESEQISIFLGSNYLITFQERPGDCFDAVRDRIRKSVGHLRAERADYLAYSLIDSVIDSYFPLLERFADHLDQVEDRIISNPNSRITEDLHHLRNELMMLRRTISPHRESLNQLVRGDHPLITAETRLFLRDCYDHTFQLIELLEVYREIGLDLRDYYVTLVSNRLNEIMKVLTVIATIFMPLSFIASVYGMNFNTKLPGNMPELNVPYGYLVLLLTMFSLAAAMLFSFYRMGWIGPFRRAAGGIEMPTLPTGTPADRP